MSLSHSPRVINNGLVLYLDASNARSYSGSSTTWQDLTSNAYNHTLRSTSLSVVDNVKCFDVSTSGKSIYATAPATHYFSNEYTLISWARLLPDNSTTTWRTLWRSSTTHPLLVENDTNMIGGYYSAFRSYGLNATTLGIENKWTMYTIVASGGVSNCYINDGSMVGTSIPYNENGKSHWTIGTYNVPGSQPFGQIATASIYNRALSVSEIKQNYETLKGRFGL